MAQKLRGSQTASNFAKAQSNWQKPITLNNSTTTFSQLPTGLSQQPSNFNPPSEGKSPMIGQSFEKMGLGKIGGLGGRMGQLEQASMRLAQAASNRRMDEAEQEYGLRGNLAQSQANIESAHAAQMAGYSSPFEMQQDIAKKRRDNENKLRQQEDIYRIGQENTAKRTSQQPQGTYTVDRRGRRVYS